MAFIPMPDDGKHSKKTDEEKNKLTPEVAEESDTIVDQPLASPAIIEPSSHLGDQDGLMVNSMFVSAGENGSVANKTAADSASNAGASSDKAVVNSIAAGLMVALQAEDENANEWEEFCDATLDPLYRLSLAIVGNNEADAEKLIGETYSKLFEKISTYDSSQGNFFGWIRKIMNNLHNDWFRHENKTIPLLDHMGYTNKSVDESEVVNREPELKYIQSEAEKEVLAEITRIAKNLDADEREILDLKYRMGMKSQQIAELLGMPTANAVYKKIQRIKQKIKDIRSGMYRGKV